MELPALTAEHGTPEAPHPEAPEGYCEQVTEFTAQGDGGASLVFWILITLAVSVMAPCMILPAWREYQAAELSARSRAAEAQAIAKHAERLERRLDAIHNDPVVITRLARRELRCLMPGELRLAVNPAETDAGEAPGHARDRQSRTPNFDFRVAGYSPSADPSGRSGGTSRGATPGFDSAYVELFRERTPPPAPVAAEPIKPPVVVARLTAYLPPLNYDALFCTSPTRETLLGMSIALVAAAFIVFWPRHPRA
jgi:hypothetical protein